MQTPILLELLRPLPRILIALLRQFPLITRFRLFDKLSRTRDSFVGRKLALLEVRCYVDAPFDVFFVDAVVGEAGELF